MPIAEVSLYYILGCGKYGSCKCNLQLIVTSPIKQEFVAGRDTSIDFHIEIKNLGAEPSIGATLEILPNITLPPDSISGLQCEQSVSVLNTYETRKIGEI